MRLLRGVGEGVLLLWDRGLHSFEMVQATLARGCAVAGTAAPDGQARTARRDPLRRYAAGVG